MLNDNKNINRLLTDTAIFDIISTITRQSGIPGCRIEYTTSPYQEPVFTVRANNGSTLRAGLDIRAKYLDGDLLRLQQAIDEALKNHNSYNLSKPKDSQPGNTPLQESDDFFDPPF